MSQHASSVDEHQSRNAQFQEPSKGTIHVIPEEGTAPTRNHRSLQRSPREFIDLLSLDVLYIVCRIGMLAYVALLWRYKDTLIRDIPFDAGQFVQAATTVRDIHSAP